MDFQVPEDTGDIIVGKAIDLWQKHGAHSSVHGAIMDSG